MVNVKKGKETKKSVPLRCSVIPPVHGDGITATAHQQESALQSPTAVECHSRWKYLKDHK